MVKNKIGGNKHKKKKNSSQNQIQTELLLADKKNNEKYGVIKKCMGSSKFQVSLDDNTTCLAFLRGKHKKRHWMRVDDVVLVEKNFDGKGNCIVIHKYSSNHIKTLKDRKLLKFLDDCEDKELYEDCCEETLDPDEREEILKRSIAYGDELFEDSESQENESDSVDEELESL